MEGRGSRVRAGRGAQPSECRRALGASGGVADAHRCHEPAKSRRTPWRRTPQGEAPAREDRTVVDRIPVTTIARTILDLAEVLNLRQLRAILEQAERIRLFDLNDIEATIARNPGRRGIKPLRALLKDAVDLAPESRLALERAFLDFCKLHDIPRPHINTAVAGYEVDACWPDHRLVVELDSRTFHATRAAFERDRQKDAAVQLADYRVVRITYRELTRNPEGVASLLKSFLS